MSVTVLLVSIVLRVVAFSWSLVLLRRLRDWRIGLLSGMVLLMAGRQSLTLIETGSTGVSPSATAELPGLLVSVLALGFVAVLDHLLVASRTLIDERDRAQDAFERLARTAPDCFWSTEIAPDGEHSVRYVSPGWRTIWEREPEELYRDPRIWLQTIDPADRNLSEQAFEAAAAGQGSQAVTYRIHRPSGEVRWIEDRYTPIVGENGRVVAVDGIARDITEQRRAEAALASKHLAYNRLLDHLEGMAYQRRVDDSWTIELASEGCLELTGYPPSDLVDNSRVAFADLIHPEDVDEISRRCLEKLQTERQCDGEYRLLTANGEEKWVWDRGRGIFDADDKLVGVEGFVVDITPRKMAQIALRRSEIRYRGLFEDSKDAVFITRMDGSWVDANPAAVELFGFSSTQELLDSDILELYRDPTQRDHVYEKLSEEGAVVDYELALQTRDRQKVTAVATATAIVGEAGQAVGARGILRDVTKARAIEKELQESRRMEALGRLAGGLAHDFNNLLTVILGYSHLLSMDPDLSDDTLDQIGQISEASNRASALVEQLLAFARQQVLEPRVFDVHRAIQEVESLLRAGLGDDVELVLSFHANPSRIKADPGQIEQALMNISANAREAMPGGGRFEIETSNVVLDGTVLASGVSRPGSYIEIAFRDSGDGMDATTAGRAFEPFFSTKAKGGASSGLGLSTVYGIVQQSGGAISLESHPGEGTTLRIHLPQVDQPADVERPADAAIESGEMTTILVTEDDPEIAKLVERILTSAGYRPLVASRPSEALSILEQTSREIELLITDLMLPEMSGLELLERTEALRPGLKGLAISGYSEEAVQRQNEEMMDVPFLRKPFTPTELVQRVREVLGGSST